MSESEAGVTAKPLPPWCRPTVGVLFLATPPMRGTKPPAVHRATILRTGKRDIVVSVPGLYRSGEVVRFRRSYPMRDAAGIHYELSSGSSFSRTQLELRAPDDVYALWRQAQGAVADWSSQILALSEGMGAVVGGGAAKTVRDELRQLADVWHEAMIIEEKLRKRWTAAQDDFRPDRGTVPPVDLDAL